MKKGFIIPALPITLAITGCATACAGQTPTPKIASGTCSGSSPRVRGILKLKMKPIIRMVHPRARAGDNRLRTR